MTPPPKFNYVYMTLCCLTPFCTLPWKSQRFIAANKSWFTVFRRGCLCHDSMVVIFTTTCAISIYHHLLVSYEFESISWRGVLDTTLCSIYHHLSYEFESSSWWGVLNTTLCSIYHHSWRGVLDTTLCDQVCQWLAAVWCDMIFFEYSGFFHQ